MKFIFYQEILKLYHIVFCHSSAQFDAKIDIKLTMRQQKD